MSSLRNHSHSTAPEHCSAFGKNIHVTTAMIAMAIISMSSDCVVRSNEPRKTQQTERVVDTWS
jgi:hypothetical protein